MLKILLKKLFSICLFFLIINKTYSQNETNIFQHKTKITPEKEKHLYFQIDNTNFFKNNEYFNSIAAGYTLIGTHFTPSLVYYPSANTSFLAGVNLLRYSGLDKFKKTTPVFRFQYQITPKISILLGSIYANANHKLIEPLYNPEKHFTNPVETGLQFLFDYERFSADIWLNWENFIFQKSSEQEVLSVGFSPEFKLTKSDKKFQTAISLQSVISHRGGQIDTIEANLQTLMNLASGFKMKYSFENNSFIKAIELQPYYLIYKDNSHEKEYAFSKGNALFANFYIHTKNSFIRFGYWQGDKFISARGEPIYMSISQNKTDYTEKNRKFLFVKWAYQFEITKGVNLKTGIDTYYDFNSKKTDYTFELHIIFRRDFFILKTK